jgi:telomere length regulation protein
MQFERLLSTLPSFEQRNLIYALLNLVSKDYLSSTITSDDDSSWWQADVNVVSANTLVDILIRGWRW